MSSKNIKWHTNSVTKEQKGSLKHQKPVILWFTGLSGSGKSTIANSVELELYKLQKHTVLLDGDNLRHGLNSDLGFDEASRNENIRRVGEVAKLFVDNGLIVLSAFVSPYKKDRDFVRSLVEKEEFVEIFIDTPLEECEKRDPKGLYKMAREGKIKDFTGISASYEEPSNPEIYIKNKNISVDEASEVIVKYLKNKGYLDVAKD